MQALPTESPPAVATGTLRLLAVTVNFRTADLSVRCLESLERERRSQPGLRVVVVDNASGDGSVERLRATVRERGWEGWVRVEASERNLGFGGGNNLALRADLAGPEQADAYLLINPDAYLEEGALTALVERMQAEPRCGAAGPRTEIGRGNPHSTAFRFPSLLGTFVEGMHFGPFTRLFARFVHIPPMQPAAHVADWVSGGCLLLRREMLEQVGLFDDAYFLYYEETDLLRRAGEAGWQTWYEPRSLAVHDSGAATGVTGASALQRPRPAYWFDARRTYLRKHHGRLGALAIDLAWLLGNVLWQLRRRLSGKGPKEPPGFFRDFVRYNLLGRRADPPSSPRETAP